MLYKNVVSIKLFFEHFTITIIYPPHLTSLGLPCKSVLRPICHIYQMMARHLCPQPGQSTSQKRERPFSKNRKNTNIKANTNTKANANTNTTRLISITQQREPISKNRIDFYTAAMFYNLGLKQGSFAILAMFLTLWFYG